MGPSLEASALDWNEKSYSGEWTSLVAQLVNNLPATQETWVQSLGQEDPLAKEIATYSRILIPWTEELGKLQVHGVAKSWM